MKNLKPKMSAEDKQASYRDINNLRIYIYPLLHERQKGKCAICKKFQDEKMDIDHLIYNPSITLQELQLVCLQCHYDKHKLAHGLTEYRIKKRKGVQ